MTTQRNHGRSRRACCRAIEARRRLASGANHAIGLARATDVRDVARAVVRVQMGMVRHGVLGGADTYEEQAALEAADNDGAAAELDGDGRRLDGLWLWGRWILVLRLAQLVVVVVVAAGLVVVVVIIVLVERRGATNGIGRAGAGKGRRQSGRGGRVDGEERGGNGGVGAQDGDGLRTCMGEELAVRSGEEERGQGGRLVGVEEGREALREEKRRRGIWMGHVGQLYM
jgi:hypothetical protein